jgi:hypothetical protein
MWVIPEDLGTFSPRRKIIFWGAKIQTSFGVEFRNAPLVKELTTGCLIQGY